MEENRLNEILDVFKDFLKSEISRERVAGATEFMCLLFSKLKEDSYDRIKCSVCGETALHFSPTEYICTDCYGKK